MGISFLTTAVARRSQFHQDILSSHIAASSLTSQQDLARLTHLMEQRGFNPVTAGQKAYDVLYQMLQQQASLLSYVDVFHMMAILFLAIIPLVLLMRRTTSKGPAGSAH